MVSLANGITAAWANIAGPLISDLWFPARERTLATATAPQDEDLTMDALSTGKWLFDMFDCLGFLKTPTTWKIDKLGVDLFSSDLLQYQW